MSEIRRFMRYVLPGLVCVVQLLAILLYSDKYLSKKYINFVSRSFDGLGTVLLIFLAAGAFGFILSSIYFSIRWEVKFLSMDHRILFYQLNDKIQDENKTIINPSHLDLREAWTLFIQFWNTERESHPELKSSDAYFARASGVLSGIGATAIGTVLSFFLWLWMHFSNGMDRHTLWTNGLPILFWILLFIMYGADYYVTKKSLQAMLNSTLMKVLSNKKGHRKVFVFSGGSKAAAAKIAEENIL